MRFYSVFAFLIFFLINSSFAQEDTKPFLVFSGDDQTPGKLHGARPLERISVVEKQFLLLMVADVCMLKRRQSLLFHFSSRVRWEITP
jgi:hypothetical protein